MAEDPKVEIAINATANTGAFATAADASDALTDSLKNLVSAAAISAFFKEAVQEAVKEAEALRQLKFAVESTGASWGDYQERIEKFAAARQALTRFDDTVTIEVLGRLTRVTGDAAMAMTGTALAQDIASASGKDLAQTSELVANLLAGQERAVMQARKEFGAYVGAATNAQEALDALKKGFDGASVSEESFTKGLNQSKASLADFSQKVGEGMIKPLQVVIDFLMLIPIGLEKTAVTIAFLAASTQIKFGGAFEYLKQLFTGSLADVLKASAQTAAEMKALSEETTNEIADIDARYNGQKAAQEEQKALRARESEDAKRTAAEAEEEMKKRAAEAEEARFVARDELSQRSADWKEQMIKREDDAETATGVKSLAAQKKLNEDKKANMAATLSYISTLTSAKSKELQIIGKAAAMAQATVDASVAILASYKWGAGIGGPILGGVFAGLAATATAAQLSKIAGVELEEGGMVPGSAGGTRATIGEKGKAEAVIPLTDRRATDAIAKAIGGGGGGTTIQNVFVLPGLEALRDPAVAEEIMQIVADQMERRTPSAVVASRRIADLSELNAGRA